MMDPMPALHDLDALQVAAQYAAGALSPTEFARACLDRIESWQPRTNAFLRLNGEKALERARAMDKEIAAGKRRSALHGVPMAHKDMYYQAGKLSTAGSALRRDWRPGYTSTAVERMAADRARDALLAELDRYAAKLAAIRPLVENGDGAALERLFAEARAARERWLAVFDAAFDRFCGDVESGRDTFLDPYAAEHEAEFFAVASEAFFESPNALKAEYPMLYGLFRDFYRQDPAKRLPT